jgi:transposase-like protein
MSFSEARRKYGIKGSNTVGDWVRRYGNGTRGKVIRVDKPEEIEEKKQLKLRIKQLEKALVNAHIDLALEEGYLDMACRRAGIKDVSAFKKKVDGEQSIKA